MKKFVYEFSVCVGDIWKTPQGYYARVTKLEKEVEFPIVYFELYGDIKCTQPIANHCLDDDVKKKWVKGFQMLIDEWVHIL